MPLFFFLVFIAMPVLIMSLALWLSMKMTKVESTFMEMLRLAIVIRFVTLVPYIGEPLSLAALFIFLYKWEGIKFWPEVKFWPDSLLVGIIGWGAYFAASRIPLVIMRLFK